jgi:RCC1-like G exchanging factor-like protein
MTISKDNGEVYSCGYGALGLGKGIIETLEPRRVQIDEKIIKISAVQDMAAAISGVYFNSAFNVCLLN